MTVESVFNHSASKAISIIVPVFNDYQRLSLCVNALLPQLDAADAELIVVDNGSPDVDQTVVGVLNSHQRTKYLIELEPGSYSARNAGLKVAEGRIIAFTDSDCIPEPDWLEQGLAILNHTHNDLIAGNITVFCASNGPRTLLESFERVLAFPQRENATLGRSVTANFWIRRAIVERIGRFDCQAFSGADYEFSSRAVKHGAVMTFGEQCIVAHPARRELSDMRQKLRRVVGGFYRLQNKDPAMAAQLSWQALLSDAAPPIQALKSCIRQKQTLQLSNYEIARVLFVALHNKWYRLWLKLRVKAGLVGFVER
ncbi:glycosyltransferase family 2 protein [Neiella sp. HB171785]|uniref:Glycosyltransferase family 2 protein n=1 Tax=Neiella litorisoli TaxID=2771431 RepID=A0A8J6UQ86_9GAMM|nr:glycosyltransferase family A protein [Neiella litorisoli]MBD1390557.1 glycosyltransferase family 2 protein [Neiella litorisoli]